MSYLRQTMRSLVLVGFFCWSINSQRETQQPGDNLPAMDDSATVKATTCILRSKLAKYQLKLLGHVPVSGLANTSCTLYMVSHHLSLHI